MDQVVIGAAGAAGDNPLVHPDIAVPVHLGGQIHPDVGGKLLICRFLRLPQDIARVLLQLPDRSHVGGVHGQGDGALDGAQVHSDAARIVGDFRRLKPLEILGPSVEGKIFLCPLVRCPNRGPASGFGGHNINAVAVLDRQTGHAGAYKFHDLIFYITALIDRADNGQGNIVGAYAGAGGSGEIDRNHLRPGEAVGPAQQLLGQLSAPLTHGQGTQRPVAGVAV